MKDRFVSELESFNDAKDKAQSFIVEVTLINDKLIRSTNIPISALAQTLVDMELVDEGASLPIWDRAQNSLCVIPARNVLYVKVVFLQTSTTSH